jgi:ABC-type amino acid transport substrate-binding protein
MMKKTVKSISYVLLAVFLMFTLAGCGQTGQSNQPEDNGKEVWIVGTSPDYEPFEFVNEQGEYDGYDMDLIKEVGKRLDVEVKIEALEFESLIASLKQGKIDAIISCMSSDPERLKEADFTMPYYLVKDGVLVNPESDIEIKELDDVLKYVFAVQTGTTMDKWATTKAEENLVKDSQIKRYTDANAAALDVKNGRVDAFLVDLPVAEIKAKELELKVAFSCALDEGSPCIVLPKGSDEMLEKLNGIIEDMKEDGTLKALEDKWLEN